MKKRTLSTLLLAGVMAAAMVPTAVFAATPAPTKSTTVGYTAGGNVSPDGTVMVSVPMTTDFKDLTTELDFNVNSYVWVMDTTTGVGSWKTPDANNRLGADANINVSVTSENGFNLRRESTNKQGQGTYQYKVDGLTYSNGDDGIQQDGILNTATGTKKVALGTLKDGTEGDANTGSKYAITGKVKMTKAPNAGQMEGPTRFYDKLTFEFDGLQNINANADA